MSQRQRFTDRAFCFNDGIADLGQSGEFLPTDVFEGCSDRILAMFGGKSGGKSRSPFELKNLTCATLTG